MSSTIIKQTGYHAYQTALTTQFVAIETFQQAVFKYTFANFFHPFVGELIERLNNESLAAMLAPPCPQGVATGVFATFCPAQATRLVSVTHFPKEIDVREQGPYANYN